MKHCTSGQLWLRMKNKELLGKQEREEIKKSLRKRRLKEPESKTKPRSSKVCLTQQDLGTPHLLGRGLWQWKEKLPQIQALQLLPSPRGCARALEPNSPKPWGQEGQICIQTPICIQIPICIQTPICTQMCIQTQICIQTLQLGFILSQDQHKEHKQMQRKQLKQSSHRGGVSETSFGLGWIFISSVGRVLGRSAGGASAVTACPGPLSTGSEGQNGPSAAPARPGEHRNLESGVPGVHPPGAAMHCSQWQEPGASPVAHTQSSEDLQPGGEPGTQLGVPPARGKIRIKTK